MKRITNILISAVAVLSLSGCGDYLDINRDPNSLGDIPDAKVLLPSAQVTVANNLMGWDFGFGGGYWVEYWTQNYTSSQFKNLCQYDNTVDFNTAYMSLTSGGLKDLKIISDKTKDGAKGYYFIAEALTIFTWQMITDVWGDMPYFEALKGDGNVLHPKVDDSQAIYTDLLRRVDELLAVDVTGHEISAKDSKYDFVYAGDLDKWREFAYSLKLKLMIRTSETSGYNNAAVLSFIENPQTSFISQSAMIAGSYWDDNSPGKRHPMREFMTDGANYTSNDVIACKSFTDYLNKLNDPRSAKIFTQVGGKAKGAFFGDFDSKVDSDGNGTTDDKEAYSRAVFTGDMDLIIMSTWEVNFYIAEVYARAGDEPNAKAYYDAGVAASLAQHKITDLSFIGAGGAAEWVNNGNVEANIKQIAMQRWIAHANYQHIESFLERNRTKYPSVNEIDIKSDRREAFRSFPVGDLTISVQGRQRTNGYLPASPAYPSALMQRNNNAPQQKPNLLQKAWWDKKAGK